eukprot:jgi/Bigna1/79004/fgenesh1_pg.59_\
MITTSRNPNIMVQMVTAKVQKRNEWVSRNQMSSSSNSDEGGSKNSTESATFDTILEGRDKDGNIERKSLVNTKYKRICALIGDIATLEEDWKTQREAGIKVDERDYEDLILACVINKDPFNAIRWFRQMKTDGFSNETAKHVSLVAQVIAAAEIGKLETAENLMRDIERSNKDLPVRVYKTLLKGCTLTGDVIRAEKYLKIIGAAVTDLDYENVIATYAISGDSETAKRYLSSSQLFGDERRLAKQDTAQNISGGSETAKRYLFGSQLNGDERRLGQQDKAQNITDEKLIEAVESGLVVLKLRAIDNIVPSVKVFEKLIFSKFTNDADLSLALAKFPKSAASFKLLEGLKVVTQGYEKPTSKLFFINTCVKFCIVCWDYVKARKLFEYVEELGLDSLNKENIIHREAMQQLYTNMILADTAGWKAYWSKFCAYVPFKADALKFFLSITVPKNEIREKRGVQYVTAHKKAFINVQANVLRKGGEHGLRKGDDDVKYRLLVSQLVLCARNRDPESAELWMSKLHRKQSLGLTVYREMLNAYRENGEFSRVEYWFNMIERKNLKKDFNCYFAFIQACYQRGLFERAIAVYEENIQILEKKDIDYKPRMKSLMAVTYLGAGRREKTDEIIEQMLEERINHKSMKKLMWLVLNNIMDGSAPGGVLLLEHYINWKSLRKYIDEDFLKYTIRFIKWGKLRL